MGLYLAIFTGLAALIIVLSPFAIGSGGSLALASTQQNLSDLLVARSTIVNRYLLDEEAFNRGELPRKQWQSRRRFLVNRYLDVARRIQVLEASTTNDETRVPT